jgi:hypothetical protein
MHSERLLTLHRQIRALHRAEYLADDRYDFEATVRLQEAQRPLLDKLQELKPQSDGDAAFKLHDVANLILMQYNVDEEDEDAREIAEFGQEMRRVARAIMEGTWIALDLARLRTLLPATERVAEETDIKAGETIKEVLAWLARPKLCVGSPNPGS